MKALLKVFICSLFICFAFIGAWFSIDYMRMDNASKGWLQAIYYIILLVVVLLGNVVLFTRTTNPKAGFFLFDFSMAMLTLSIGLIGVFWIYSGQFSTSQLGCMMISILGLIGIIRTAIVAKRVL